MTLTDLAEKLKREEETLLVELLALTSEDLVERFLDVIEERFDVLVEQIDD